MESIVINQKKMACEVFQAFSLSRWMHGRIIQACISDNDFIWQVYPVGYYESDKDLLEKPDYPKVKVEYKISRDHVAFRSSDMGDIAMEFLSHWDAFSRRESRLIIPSVD